MSIYKRIIQQIENHDTIILHRHERPDMDAVGSQYGFALILKENFPSKNIYVVGDINDMIYKAKMDVIDDEVYNNALAIITDVAIEKMVSDPRFKLAKTRIIIDHHQNETTIEDVLIYFKNPKYGSACELIIEIAKNTKLRIPPEAATYLYGGMVTDTGRFMFLSNPSKTFELASYITRFNPNIQDFYDYIYTEPLAKRQAKNLFSNFELTENNVAYRKNDAEVVKKSGLDFQSISRGMVNQMAGIKEVRIWANFTEDEVNQEVVCEFRSRGITIVDIAKKYGGGGHNNACGATVKSFDIVDQILIDLDERAKRYGNT